MTKQNRRIKNIYQVGQGIATQDVNQLVDYLLKRDLPQIAALPMDGLIGSTFVPEGFIPKCPCIIDPSTTVLKSQLEELHELET